MAYCRNGLHEVEPDNRVRHGKRITCLPCKRLRDREGAQRRRAGRSGGVRGDAPYPRYTGDEECVGKNMHPEPPLGLSAESVQRPLVAVCDGCPIMDSCREWAVHHERWGVWGGTTEGDRDRIRAVRGIRVADPTLNLDIQIIRARARALAQEAM